MTPRWRFVCGWVAAGASCAALIFWTAWGSIETFYEGWYYRSLWMNLALTVAQYLLPALLLGLAAVTGVVWPRFGAIVHAGLAAGVALKLNTPSGRLLIALPLVALAVLYWCAKFRSKRWTLYWICGVPVLTGLVCGTWPAYRALGRLDDGDRGARIVAGNGVRLRWAPAGPGWPERGTNWLAAQETCVHLATDGRSVEGVLHNIWRLPTADELTRSLTFRGANAGGVWINGATSYRVTPEKESPLWNRYSPVIYWWTATEVDDKRAYRFSYNGRAMVTRKSARPAYYGFRCVSR